MAEPAIELPDRLFRIPAYLPYLQPQLTCTAITKAQTKIGVTLPAAYIVALRAQNGGY